MEIPCAPQMTQPDTSPAWRHAHPSFAASPNLTDRWFVLGRGAQTALSGRQAAESRSSQRRLPISPPNSGYTRLPGKVERRVTLCYTYSQRDSRLSGDVVQQRYRPWPPQP
ncbi:hypothetical protein AnigIFM49718_003528 [Aspergillus niger]|nr:hypothetical protein AnigIFM49718_003528 [Aspergillus niger]